MLVRSLDAHGHWVNHLALSSAYALRNSQGPLSSEVLKRATFRVGLMVAALVPYTHFLFLVAEGMSALQQYKRACSKHGEVMVSASDDNTLMLWNPSVR